MTRPTRRSVEQRLGELEPESGLEAEHYLVHGPGIDGFDSMTRVEYVRYCGRVGEERIGEVSAQPLAEGDPNADSHDIDAGRSSLTLTRVLAGSLQGSYTEFAVHGRLEADGPLSARELADRLPRTRMSVHRALRDLREAALVERSLASGSDGRRTVYVLNDGT